MPTVGIPRSLFFHTEGKLLCAYLDGLRVDYVTSRPTDRRIFERGVSLAVDETCLPVKIHLGHVDAVRDSSDVVLVPRYGEADAAHGDMCVKLWGAHDVTRNCFPDLHTISYNVDHLRGDSETRALLGLGRSLGSSRGAARRALADAHRCAEAARSRRAERQEREMMGATASGRPVILVAAHGYILDDEMMGAPVLRMLERQGVVVARSDRLPDPQRIQRRGLEFSPALKWAYNREQVGAIEELRDRVDGIVLLVSFPCGPDSLVAELVQRKVRDVPVCTIVLDELTAAGGLQTRIESFCDIVKMREICRSGAAR